MIDKLNYMPYLLIKTSKPARPILDCFGPRICPKVVWGIVSRFEGMIITSHRSLTNFFIALPWLASRSITQPSFLSNLTNFLPEMAGNSVYIFLDRNQLTDRLDARPHKVIAISFDTNGCLAWHACIERDVVLFKEPFPLSNAIETIEMKHHCFFKSFLNFIKRTSKHRRTQLFTNTNPRTVFFVILAGEDYITSHNSLLLRGLLIRFVILVGVYTIVKRHEEKSVYAHSQIIHTLIPIVYNFSHTLVKNRRAVESA